jgi:hypothetical protein
VVAKRKPLIDAHELPPEVQLSNNCTVNPMRVGFIASVLLLLILEAASAVQAQTTVDVAKITCRQFLLGHVGGSTRSVANWLSGYYNGKRGNTVIEVGSMQKNVRDLERYCRKNHEMPVMDAAKNTLGAEK